MAVTREIVEQWLRARGWAVRIRRDGAEDWGPTGVVVAESPPHASLVWALLLEAQPLRDGSRCKRCRGCGTWHVWWRATYDEYMSPLNVLDAVESWRNVGWQAEAQELADGYEVRTARPIPCVDCMGTGLADLTDAYAQHVLDAQPRPNATGLRFITTAGTNGVVLSYRVDGASETSIEALSVLADRLQAKGHRLGQRIALLLADTPETIAELEREGGETLRSITALRSIREARTTTGESFRIDSQSTVFVRVGDDGVHQRAMFSIGDFADFRRATAAEVVAAIMEQVMNVEARVDDGHVVIAGVGEDGSPVGVQITGGTAFDFMYVMPEARIAPLVRALALG